MQRVFDVIFSGLAILVLSPLLMPIILILRVTGEGEVFFLQDRIGRDGKLFKLCKFATMLKDSPNMGSGTVTLSDDPRVLPLGSTLREYKINELPQLINIFKGDMSVIGPRPQTKRCFNAFSEEVRQDILKVRPGLSGLGVLIIYNEERMMKSQEDADSFYDDVIMAYKGVLEQWYVRNNSVILYFVLIAATLVALVSKSSATLFKLYPTLPVVPQALQPFILPGAYQNE